MSEVKILKIEKKGKKYLVYTTEDEEPIKLTEDAIVNNRILKDALFDKEGWEKIKKGKDTANLFDKVLHYIDFKPRTEKEVIDYLIKKEAEQETIDEIITRLKDIRYLDDNKYALAFIEEGIKNKKGPQLISYQLVELGINKNLIQHHLEIYTYELQIENATIIAKKYQQLQLKHPAKKQRELIYQKLIRGGFDHNIINIVIEQLVFFEDSIDKLEEEYQKLLLKKLDRNKIIASLMSKGYCYEDIKKVIKTSI